jgi:hypothetical protein
MMRLILSLLAVAGLSVGQGKQTFVGIITDDMCEKADHSHMRMGSTDAECTIACISEHGAAYVLYDGKDVYRLSELRAPEQFAGRKVAVTGALEANGKTIRVASIRAAKK